MYNIGDKYLKMDNVENISTLRILIIDDVFELSHTENAYECTLKQYADTKNVHFSEN